MPVAGGTEARQVAGDRAVLTFDGELDLATAPELRAAVADLLGQGVRRIELDLHACTFLDSSGMGALLWAERRLQAAGGGLVIAGAHGAVARTLEVSGVRRALAVHA